MSDSDIEKRLTELGRTTERQTSMRAEVMRRIEAMSPESSWPPSPALPREYRGREENTLRFRRAAVVLLATAACICLLVFLRWPAAPIRSETHVVVIPLGPQTHVALPSTETSPRLADLQRAYAQSPEAFERLLQRPLSGTSRAAEVPLSAGDAVRLDSKLYQ
jgi:hypothetical protein